MIQRLLVGLHVHSVVLPWVAHGQLTLRPHGLGLVMWSICAIVSARLYVTMRGVSVVVARLLVAILRCLDPSRLLLEVMGWCRLRIIVSRRGLVCGMGIVGHGCLSGGR